MNTMMRSGIFYGLMLLWVLLGTIPAVRTFTMLSRGRDSSLWDYWKGFCVLFVVETLAFTILFVGICVYLQSFDRNLLVNFTFLSLAAGLCVAAGTVMHAAELRFFWGPGIARLKKRVPKKVWERFRVDELLGLRGKENPKNDSEPP